jgi:hypothetical protein
MATLGLFSLTCHQTEDSTGSDEAYLKVNGETVFGPTSINDGQTIKFEDVITVRFNGQALVELFDEDSRTRTTLWAAFQSLNRKKTPRTPGISRATVLLIP